MISRDDSQNITEPFLRYVIIATIYIALIMVAFWLSLHLQVRWAWTTPPSNKDASNAGRNLRIRGADSGQTPIRIVAWLRHADARDVTATRPRAATDSSALWSRPSPSTGKKAI